jgi:hypothetical protein
MHFLKRLFERSQCAIDLFRRLRRPPRRATAAHPHRTVSFRPQVEGLEDRCMPSSFLVSNLSGDPTTVGSLPYEVLQANKSATPAIITFTPGLAGTIGLSATLTVHNTTAQSITIDGSGASITVSGQNSVGDFVIVAGQTATINDLTITGGHDFLCGGIDSGGALTLTNCTLTGNFWRGIANIAGTLSMSNDIVTGNSGGGIYLHGGGATISNCTIANNTTASGGLGGGIENTTGSTLTLTSCTVTGNSAPAGFGGGIESEGTLSMTNCTVTGNSAQYGGGIGCSIGTATVINSTVANNTVTGAGADGGGITNFSKLNLLNTIVYNPNSGAATQDDVYGKITQTQGGLFGTSPLIAANGDLGSNHFNTNPLLGPLQNNGGVTLTMALQAGSAAIGAGVSSSSIGMVPSTDQTGGPRPANSPDIGAFQTPFSPSPSPSPSPTTSPGPGAPAFDANEVARDALLMAEGVLGNNAFLVYWGWLDYFHLLGTLDSAHQTQVQALCFQVFFNDCLALTGAA